jgi:hypothetical protein
MNVLKRKGLVEDEQWYGLQFTGDESVGGNLKQVENFFQKIFVHIGSKLLLISTSLFLISSGNASSASTKILNFSVFILLL